MYTFNENDREVIQPVEDSHINWLNDLLVSFTEIALQSTGQVYQLDRSIEVYL